MTISLKDRLVTTVLGPKAGGSSSNNSNNNIYLLDGGVSTHLRDLWNDDFPHPELWSSSLLLTEKGRSTILQGHRDWLASGSNILTTVTYQCHALCSGVVDDEQVDQMLRDGVQLARQAINSMESEKKTNMKEQQSTTATQRFVVASMGCYGAALADGSEYTGNYPKIQNEQDLINFHRNKTRTLLQEKPDGIALETVPCVLEVRAFVSLLRELRARDSPSADTANKTTDKQPACWISLACRNGHELNDDSPIEDALTAIDELDPDVELVQAIGINCCDSEHIASLVRIISTFLAQSQLQSKRNNTTTKGRGIVIYPNSGEEWDADTKTWKEGTGLRQDALQDVFAVRLIEAVDIVQDVWKQFHPNLPPPTILLGGCCRTRPETIRALRTEVDRRQQQQQTHSEQTETSKSKKASPSAEATTGVTAEQQRMIDQIMGRDADFDQHLGGIHDDLQDLAETQQEAGEAIKYQNSRLKVAQAKLDRM